MKIDLNKKETLIVPEDEPNGENGLSSRASFLQEKTYHQKSFAECLAPKG